MFGRKHILRKTIEVGSSTLLSRFLGITREILQVHFLGVGAVSDAFLAAFKIPNSLRKIFAEGALSSALIPTLVQVQKTQSKAAINRLMSLNFLVFEGALLLICLFMMIKPALIISLVAPGFSSEVVQYAVPYLRVLVPMIMFISSGALLAGVLQSSHHFLIPALAPVVLNIAYVIGLLLGIYYGIPVIYLCYIILFGSIVNFGLHIVAYRRFHFSFGRIDAQAWKNFTSLLTRFLPFMLSMSVMEINFFIDTIFASYLPTGSVTLVHYGARLMGIPLGVFAVAFSTILLPHFSRVSLYAPKRLNFYLYESAKFIWWITIPASMFLAYFAHEIFTTLFVSSKFPASAVPEAAAILMAFLIGLFAFSLNKILFNLYYALHDTQVPTWASIIATSSNAVGNYFFMQWYGAAGLALATTLSGVFQMLFLIWFLKERYHFVFYIKEFISFVVRFSAQLVIATMSFLVVHSTLFKVINARESAFVHKFFINGIGFWFWTGPLALIAFIWIFYTRRAFGYKMHFLD